MGKKVVGLKTLYCAELPVCRCHFSVYFDPEEWFWAGESDEKGKPARWVWLSPVFADRYSARNWAYCRLRECFLRKIPSGVLALSTPFISPFAVTEITVESQLAERMIGETPMRSGISIFEYDMMPSSCFVFRVGHGRMYLSLRCQKTSPSHSFLIASSTIPAVWAKPTAVLGLLNPSSN